ncbi:hypothetical protein NO559_03650 [Dasania sp. GY-MA-18]|uniref:Uncharacterized protein n=1 Tax=Dasania phycosphaerae TaxID=2950436 RepID=A0A9J6RJ55_9GAMM|nr:MULTISPECIES: hypothetical protein [Dasania]MCR8921852.1 hypothetical protein [Dasania sp. GY-MA-18]MCZ0864280.1 hypothetical protein [Dasania phycosphaerae]MCZ0868008.1 hypothetical protein [Dasania phycosphaerae]
MDFKDWNIVHRSLLLVFIYAVSSNVVASAVDDYHFEGSIAKHSRYVAEGRDNINGKDLYSLEAFAYWQSFAATLWYGHGVDDPYKELKVGLEYGFDWGDTEFTVAYTRLTFLDSNENDNEFSLAIVFQDVFSVVPSVDYVYATEASGGFLELSLSSLFEFKEQGVSIEPYITEGFDLGFATKKHDGPNHLQLGVDVSYHLSPSTAIIANINKSWSQKDIHREGLGDQFWLSLGFSIAL